MMRYTSVQNAISLLGVNLYQAHGYTRTFPGDPKWIKILVREYLIYFDEGLTVASARQVALTVLARLGAATGIY